MPKILSYILIIGFGILPILLLIFLITEQYRFFNGDYEILGALFFMFGLLISINNFWSSIIRPYRLEKKGITLEEAGNISVTPFFGIFVIVGAFFIPMSLYLNVLIGLLLIIDTGSISWFLVCFCTDKELRA